MMEPEICYRILESRDRRYDGIFYVGVASTGIYCRPSCPARTPRRSQVRFFATGAAAQEAGFRACKRCRPDASPGSPEWNLRADVAGRAMRLILDGVVDRDGVEGLAGQLGYSTRQLNRVLVAEVGAGALALARAQRAQTARVLLQTTKLPVAEVAFASGFSSIRQCNATMREVFAETPSALREAKAHWRDDRPKGVIRLRLAYREPFDYVAMLRFLGDRAVPGVEAVAGLRYMRVLALPHGLGIATVQPAKVHASSAYLHCDLQLADVRDLAAATERMRRLFDLDADSLRVAEALGRDQALGPFVRRQPGLRLPGAVDGAELAVRAVLGQQISVAGARTLAGRLTEAYGEPLAYPQGPLTHAFPTAPAIAALDPATLPMPRQRAQTLVALAQAIAQGTIELHQGADRDEVSRRLLALRGIGPWTVQYVRMRALGDPDAFLPSDLGVRRALTRLGLAGDAESAARGAETWRPWRAYAVRYLWASLETPDPNTREEAMSE